MTVYTEAGPARNNHLPYPYGLTTGGRSIWIRTHWSVSLCNAVALLAGIGGER